MKNININPSTVFLFLAGVIFFSCKKFLQIPPPQNRLVNTAVFHDSATATATVLGIYEKMMENVNSFANGAVVLYTGLAGDELRCLPSKVTYSEFFANQITPANSSLHRDLWKSGYSILLQANSVLDGLKNSGLPAGLEKQLEGEAKFVRAFCHFYLLNLFGDIPMLTTSDYLLNAQAARTNSDSVYRQILRDLLDAESMLADNYVDGQNQPTGEKVRPNKWVATALLARVYLFNRNWKDAEDKAGSLIAQSDRYTLSSDLNTVFLAGSSEAIWQLMPVTPDQNAGEGYMFAQSTGLPAYGYLDSGLRTGFDPGDQRAVDWISSYSYNGTTYYAPAKYKVKLSEDLTEYNSVFRLAEQYLIRAEGRNEEHDLAGAAEDLNMIRSRAGLAPTTASDYASMQTAIEQERRHELFCEWGHRWMDLKRTGKIDAVLAIVKPNWQPTDALFPIPQSEIQNDPRLVQNPGY